MRYVFTSEYSKWGKSPIISLSSDGIDMTSCSAMTLMRQIDQQYSVAFYFILLKHIQS